MNFKDYFWWGLKVTCGFALIVNVLVNALSSESFAHPLFHIPLWIGQCLAVVGALIHLWHYAILKRIVTHLSKPSHLVSKGGLFGYIRHPMYLGDIFVMLGLCFLHPDAVGVTLLAAGGVAVTIQAAVEDGMLEKKFGNTFQRWKTRTKLILPGLL